VTLIVSLRIPDGIVLAGDSLSTLMAGRKVEGEIDVACPQCNHQHSVTAQLESPALPATSFSFAQKIFPFMGEFGVGTAGHAQLMGKTMYFAIRELEKQLLALPEDARPKTLSGVAAAVGEHVLKLLHMQAAISGIPIDNLASNVVSFQVVGYEGGEAKTYIVNIGKEIEQITYSGSGCTVIGQQEVVAAIWGLLTSP
jgi:hypothetical protein